MYTLKQMIEFFLLTVYTDCFVYKLYLLKMYNIIKRKHFEYEILDNFRRDMFMVNTRD